MSSNTYLNLFYRLPVIGLCCLIFWQSSNPAVVSDPLFPHDDKVFHFFVYAVLAFLAARDLKKERPLWTLKQVVFAAAIFATLYGGSDELHQAMIPSRHASILDFLADGCGSIAGVFIFLKIESLKAQRN